MKKHSIVTFGVLCFTLLFVFALAGCKGSNGTNGISGATHGTVSGTVQTSTLVGIDGVTVTTSPDAGTATTDTAGAYSLSLPGGTYTITFAKTGYTTATATVNVANGIQTPLNATMPVGSSGAPSVALAASGNDVGYGAAFTVTATATSPLGGTLSYSWTGITGSSTTNTATATSQSFSSALAGTTNQADVPAFQQDYRFGVLPINADTRGTKSVSVTVTDGMGGSTLASVSVNSAAPQTGLAQVAIGIPVFLNSGIAGDTTTTWSLTGIPGTSALTASSIVTTGTDTRNPWFVPDVEGAYTVTASTGDSVTIYAGKFVGSIQGGTDVTKTITSADKSKWSSMWLGSVPVTSSVTFTNWPTVTPNGACTGCHNGGIAPDMFTPWADTVHASFFARGLEGITSNSNSCVACHTTGADGVVASNDGYDDAVAATGFVYKKYQGAWQDLGTSSTYASVARMASIGCENCHGAQGTVSSGHMSTAGDEYSASAVRVSFSSDICGQCHASGTGHHNYSEWVNSINPDSGMGHSKPQNRPLGYSHANPSCACHDAQAFDQWLDSLNSGTVSRDFPNVSAEVAQPQTCVACHDPHNDSNPNQLRVYDNTPNLMAGYAAEGYGKGAICVICHNLRDGQACASAPTATGVCANASNTATFLHEDGHEAEVYATSAVSLNSAGTGTYTTNPSSPHDNSAGSVFAGRNAYFMEGLLPMQSKHAAVEDTCVGCHMDLNPQTHIGHGAAAVSTHLFYIKDADRATLCANCHSANVDGEAVVKNTENLLAELQAAETNYIKARINGNLSGAYYYDSSLSSTVAFTTAIDTVTPESGHGLPTFTLTDTAGDVYTGLSAANIYTSAAQTALFFGDSATNTVAGKLFKACWNYTLIEEDRSDGIHNPSFVSAVLTRSIAQMEDTTN